MNLSTEISLLSIEISTRKGGKQSDKRYTHPYPSNIRTETADKRGGKTEQDKHVRLRSDSNIHKNCKGEIDMRENSRICNVLNELTVEEFLETYSESVQERMSELGYYVQDGLICID